MLIDTEPGLQPPGDTHCIPETPPGKGLPVEPFQWQK